MGISDNVVVAISNDNRFKNYEAGRLTGNMSRPHSKAANDSEFDFPSGKSSITYHDEKSGHLSKNESQEAFNLDQGTVHEEI